MIFHSLAVLIALPLHVDGCASVPADSAQHASSGACSFERDIGDRKIGPIRIGSSLDEIRADYTVVPARLPYSDEMGYQVTVCDEETSLIVKFDESNSAVSISTTSPSFQTDRGGKVGMSLEQLLTLHPDGIVSTGVEEGGWIAFRLDRISGYFEFSLQDIAFSCLRDHRTCPSEFYERPAIRYWAR